MLSTGTMKWELYNRDRLAIMKTKTFVRRTITDAATFREKRFGPTKLTKKASTTYINGG